MNVIDRCKELLYSTETELQHLVGEAARRGDYDIVFQITSTAKELGNVISRLTESDSRVADRKVVTNTCKRLQTKSARSIKDNGSTRRRKSANKTKRKSQQKVGNGDSYPKFFRHGDELIKVGWSKSSKKEYQHKAAESILLLVASAISDLANDQKLVSTDEFLPLIDPSNGSEIPAYQAYLCIAWLRDENLITQDGRQGYRVSETGLLLNRLREQWSQLTEK